VRDAVGDLVAGVRAVASSARWQSPDTWHLTLRFLGETPAAEVPRLAGLLREVAVSRAPFLTELRGAGSFGGGHRPLVAWIGVGQGSEELAALAAMLGRAIDPDGDNGRLRAHLTVARDAPLELVGALRTAMSADPRLAWTSDRVVLYRSVLGPRGSTHTELVSAPLGGERE
jgi:2'-5' RNA ligase